MTTPSSTDYSQGCATDLHTSLGEGGSLPEDYLLKSNQKLDAFADLVNRGQLVDRGSRDWMLAQVDFIVETIGNESLELGDEMRSNLLQLLLAIANLNERIRRQTSSSH